MQKIIRTLNFILCSYYSGVSKKVLIKIFYKENQLKTLQFKYSLITSIL